MAGFEQRDGAKATPILPMPLKSIEMQVATGKAEDWACTSSLLQVVELGGLENTTKCGVILFQVWMYGRLWFTGEAGTDLGRTDWFLMNGWCLYRVW